VSGRTTATFTLDQRADRWALPDRSIQRFRSGLAYRPVTLDLHPERNGVRLTLAFDMPAEGSPAVNRYQATLFDLDHPLLQRELSVDVRPSGIGATRCRFESTPRRALVLARRAGRAGADAGAGDANGARGGRAPLDAADLGRHRHAPGRAWLDDYRLLRVP
jgi:hypothetical protein